MKYLVKLYSVQEVEVEASSKEEAQENAMQDKNILIKRPNYRCLPNPNNEDVTEIE